MGEKLKFLAICPLSAHFCKNIWPQKMGKNDQKSAKNGQKVVFLGCF